MFPRLHLVLLAGLLAGLLPGRLTAGVAPGHAAPASRAAGDVDPPNIVVFMVDDLGWQDLSLPLGPEPTEFNRRYHTPNVERVAARGTVFTNAYSASPVCTPTRTAFMTGLHPGRTGITYWTLRRDSDTSSRHPRLRRPDWRHRGLDRTDTTLPALLGDHGYRTIHVGKAHFGALDTPGADPTNLGFEVNVAGHAPGGPGSFYGLHDFGARKRQGKEGPSVWDVPGLDAEHGRDVYLTEVLADRAVEEIDRSVEEGRPFFLHFAPYAVHAPIMANHRHLHRYEGLDRREAAYATMIESMDEALGRVLDRLETLDVADDTIVVFASDNGGLSAHARGGERHGHNAPLRSGKGSAYEGGVRIPMIVAGIGDRGRRVDVPVTTTDLFPTLLDLAGTSWRDDASGPVDGVSIEPLLEAGRAGDGPASDRVLAWHMPHQWGASGPGIEPFTSIRKGRWKLLYFHDGPRVEVYDLEEDIGEGTDLASSRPDLVRALLLDLQAWIDDTGARLSIDVETGNEIESPAAHAATR